MSAAPYEERLRLPDRVRRMNTVKWMILAVLISLLTSICLAAEKSDAPKPAQSTDELRQQLEKILKDTHTNGVSVAIVHKDGPEWVTGLGIADVASGRAATAETLFRITEEARSLVVRKAPAGEIRRLAMAQGMVTLREDAWAKACAGLTTVEEILRVTQEDT